MARTLPPDVIVLSRELLLHARATRTRGEARITQARSYRLAPETFVAGALAPQLANEPALADSLRRVRMQAGRIDKVALLLPDSWFRINLVELASFHEHQADALDVVRWSLKRTLPVPPEEMRVAYEVLSRSGGVAKLLVVSALESTLAALENVFAGAGLPVVAIEPTGLNLWNAISAAEPATTKDRLFLYVREGEFTTAVFRGAQPLFVRSRNLSGERSVEQEIRVSASYLRDTLSAASFENCYLVMSGASEQIAEAVSAEFGSSVDRVDCSEFVDSMPELARSTPELAAAAGVFAA